MIQKKTLSFLKNLKKNNNREWFGENRSKYEAARDDVSEFAQHLIVSLKKENKEISANLYIGKRNRYH